MPCFRQNYLQTIGGISKAVKPGSGRDHYVVSQDWGYQGYSPVFPGPGR